LPIEGVTSEIIVEKIGPSARILTPEEVVQYASDFESGVFLTIGAGDIDRIVPSLEKIFKSKS
jgi:UDP-N-acetylmuramate--alanine ligase